MQSHPFGNWGLYPKFHNPRWPPPFYFLFFFKWGAAKKIKSFWLNFSPFQTILDTFHFFPKTNSRTHRVETMKIYPLTFSPHLLHIWYVRLVELFYWFCKRFCMFISSFFLLHSSESRIPGSDASLASALSAASFHYTFCHKVGKEMASPKSEAICESLITLS